METWVTPHSNIVNYLRYEQHVADDYHPLIVGEEVDKGQIEKKAEVYFRKFVQNWM